MTGYVIGYYLYKAKPLRPKNKYQNKVILYTQQYGVWMLGLSWLPIIGDFICVYAGYMRIHWGQCLLMIILAKALRYAVLAYALLAY